MNSTDTNDRVYRNVTLVDGTGAKRRVADVSVRGDKITAIGAPSSLTGSTAIDAVGHVLAPGFIDIHSHADFPVLLDGRAHSAVTQGVTTIVPGNCGHGVAPFTEGHGARQSDLSSSVRREYLDDIGDFSDFGVYLEKVRTRGVGVNVLPLVAHGVLRASVAGFEVRELTSKEIATMVAMADEAMDAGAIGLSTGLEYAPGIAASTKELEAIAVPVGARSGFYATHCRNRSDRIVDAATEAVRIAESSGSRLQMSHFLRRPTGPGKSLAQQAMQVVRDADARGVRSRFDVFPFEYGPSPMMMFVPQKFREEAGVRFGEMIQDARFAQRILDDLDPRFVAMLDQGIAADMYISDDGGLGKYIGLTIGEVAARKKVPVAQAAIGLLSEAGDNFRGVIINERWVDWQDLTDALSDPDFIIMGDGSMANLDGPLQGKGFALSDWGHATATLGQFVRELELISLEEAVRRMTSAPAAQIGLENRGTIEEGRAADLVLFDPATVGSGVRPDKITVVSTGIREVLVNGVPVVQDGAVTNARPGRVGSYEVRA
jgi:N-acyl-D-amino-acid deacylase